MKKYSIGLDIGTSSVGWAVIDNDTNKVIKKRKSYKDIDGQYKKKTISLWGSRLFDEASSAEDRRLKRGARRRYARRRARIKLLRELFRDEINKVDSDFFFKLDESFYKENDVKNKKHPLTNDDKEFLKYYQKNYKTIYHLRNELVNSNEKYDIRLVYLAIHHIIKYRGNFNYVGKASNFEVEKINTLESLKALLTEYVDNIEEIKIDYNDDNLLNELDNAINEKVKKDREKKIKKVLSNLQIDDKFQKAFSKALSGYKFNVNNLLYIDGENIELSFDKADVDDEIEKNSDALGEKIDFLLDLKSLYDRISLKSIFEKYNVNIKDEKEKIKTISALKIKIYDEHGKDLKILKNIFRSNRKSFEKLFASKECTYFKYVRNQIDYSNLITDLKNEYKNLNDINKEKFDKLNDRIENGDLLPKITSTDNGQYPYQLNEVELVKIIENQSKYYPFLSDKTEDGTYKIVKILEFKIPYYVGPLNNSTSISNIKNENAWMIRNEGMEKVRITLFNFDEVINKDATAEKFIKKMISHCTYLLDEEALPNNSILYSKYKVLNELKQITYSDGVHINKLSDDVDLLNKIYNELFLKERNVTKAKFENYIRSNNIISLDIEPDIKGYSSDKGFANNMSSYIDFFGEDGIFKGTDYDTNDAEEIIEWVTIFEDKDILRRKVGKKYKDLKIKDIDRITKLSYKGWGRLSKKLLNGILSDKESRNPNMTIIDLMEKTKENFMQILHNKEYKFLETINDSNSKKINNKLDYSLVEDLATSPANKRGIWQALKIVDELVNYLGKDKLDSIYLEMARGDEKKTRKPRRKDKLQKFINDNKDVLDYEKLNDELNKLDESKINERVYLYFIQDGKSLYSKAPINLNDIGNKDLYEVDHIVPQSLIKDDSFDNKALVLREENQHKGGALMVPEEYRKNCSSWWKKLLERKLISPKKYKSLMRTNMDDKTLEGFINRQIVETRQISLHVANILRNMYEKENISFLNANISHNYRESFELFKYRDLNDYHHAKDAYLAVTLGRFKDKLLDKRKVTIVDIREKVNEMIENKDYKKLRYGYIVNSLNGNFTIANKKDGDVIDVTSLNNTIKKQMYNNDVLVTRKTEIKTGGLFNETKYAAKNVKGSIKLKDNLSLDYGGYSSLSPSYACVIKYSKKGKEEQRMVGMPIMYANKDITVKISYLKKLLELKDNDYVKIVKDKIPFNAIINWEGQICSLVGATDKVEVCNAIEFKIDSKSEEKWKYSLNRLFNGKKDIDDAKYNNELSEIILYVYNKIEKEYKLYNNLLDEFKKCICLDNLKNVDIDTKENILKEIFNLLHFNSKCANFKFLDKKYSSALGKKNDRIINHAIIINQSPTGIKENYYEF